MTKTRFQLTIKADTIIGAQALAEEEIAAFLNVDTVGLDELVDMEFAVSTPKIPEDGPEPLHRFEVTVYASVKRTAIRVL